MSKDGDGDGNGDEVIDSFTLSHGTEYAEILATKGDLVKLIVTGESIVSILVLHPEEAERIGYAMLRAAARIDPTRAKRIAVTLRGAGLTP